ncbi:MAG: FAD-dependent oxidoreductase [Thermoleophilaceae bacterium]
MARRPVILAVDDDALALDRVEDELRRRYERDYEIACEPSAEAALALMTRLDESGDRLAVVLADQWLREPHLTGETLLERARALHPDAKRALLIDWGAWGDAHTADAVLRAMATGIADFYVVKPWRSPDEPFHRAVTGFLHEWSRGSGPQDITVVGQPWSAGTHEVRRLLDSNGFAHVFHARDSGEGRALLADVGREDATAPVVQMIDGSVLVDPSTDELARACGIDTSVSEGSEFDVVVVGAGPAGLATAVYATSEGLSTLVIEREAIGGQAGSSSLIRNYLGFARGISGADLALQAHQQAWTFGTRFLRMREAVELRPGNDRHLIATGDGREVAGRAVVLAMGVAYRRLGLPELDALVGAGVFYGASRLEAAALAGRDVFIVGAGNSGGQSAVHLARSARTVTILCRGEALELTMSQYLIDQIGATPNIEVRLRTEVVDGGGDGRLEWLAIRDNTTGAVDSTEAAGLFILAGAQPHTDWLPGAIERNPRGYVVTGDAGARSLETTVPGVFAVGDVRLGSPKRVAAAVGEGSVVVSQVHDYLTTSRPFVRS